MKILVSLENEKSFQLAGDLADSVDGFKINHLMWPRVSGVVDKIGLELFVDFKLWDTPNTMKTVIESLIEGGATMATVSTYNNPAALKAISEYKDDIKLLGVTYLTSWSDQEQYNITRDMESIMWRRALERMQEYGFSGVISSAHDIATIRKVLNWDDADYKLLNICPGITIETPEGQPFHSGQVRTTSPKEAQELGADYIVLGRAITQSDNPVETLHQMRKTL